MVQSAKNIVLLLPYPLANNGRILNFINSLKIGNNLYIFALKDANPIDISNTNVKVFYYSNKNSLRNKIFRHSLFWLEYSGLSKIVIAKIENTKIDKIICFDLPSLYPAIKLKKYYNTNLHYDSLEIYPETLNQFFPEVTGIKKFFSKIIVAFMKTSGKCAEKKLVRKCDSMSTVNESLKNYFINNYGYSNISVIMNCPVFNNENITDIDFRRKYNVPDSGIIFLYQGVLNEGRGLELLIRAFGKACEINNSNRLVILGDGVLKEKLMKLTNTLNLSNFIFFHDKVPYNNLIKYTLAADVGINLLESLNLSKAYASPNKLFEYMQAEIPVLCSFSKENNIVFEKYNIGIQTHNNINCICEKIVLISEELKKDKNKYKANLLLAKKQYCWENQEKKLLELIK